MTVSVLAPSNWIEGGISTDQYTFPGTYDQDLSSIWDGTKYTVPVDSYNCGVGASPWFLKFRCPAVTQNEIKIGGKFFGSSCVTVVLYLSDESNRRCYSCISGDYYVSDSSYVGSDSIWTGYCNATIQDMDYILWEFPEPIEIVGFLFRADGGYNNGRTYQLDLFELTNPVSSEESPFWRNFQGQRELIL